MQLTLTELRKLQAQLDARIFTLHNVTRESTRLDRCLALCVEIGELAKNVGLNLPSFLGTPAAETPPVAKPEPKAKA